MNKYKHRLPQDLRLLAAVYENDRLWLETLACAAATAVFVLVLAFA